MNFLYTLNALLLSSALFFAYHFSATAAENIPLRCDAFNITTSTGNEIKYKEGFEAIAFSDSLFIAKNLIGVGAKTTLNNCSFIESSGEDQEVDVLLSPKESSLAGFVILLDQNRQPSSKTFSAQNLPEAMTTSTWGTNFELTDPEGKTLEAGLYFRKRLNKIWEYYFVFPAEKLENTQEEAGKAIIIEVGTLTFDADGKLATWKRWLNEPEDPDSRFFSRLLPADYQDLKAGELSLNPEGPPHFHWKDGPSFNYFQLDFGQNNDSTASISLQQAKMKRLGFAHDGRKKVE